MKKSTNDLLQEQEIKNLTASLKTLHQEVTSGFHGVHKRQDVTNGRIGKLENWRAFMSGGLAVLTMLVVPVLLYIITKGI